MGDISKSRRTIAAIAVEQRAPISEWHRVDAVGEGNCVVDERGWPIGALLVAYTRATGGFPPIHLRGTVNAN